MYGDPPTTTKTLSCDADSLDGGGDAAEEHGGGGGGGEEEVGAEDDDILEVRLKSEIEDGVERLSDIFI